MLSCFQAPDGSAINDENMCINQQLPDIIMATDEDKNGDPIKPTKVVKYRILDFNFTKLCKT